MPERETPKFEREIDLVSKYGKRVVLRDFTNPDGTKVDFLL